MLSKIKELVDWKLVHRLGFLRFSKTSFIFILLIPILLKVTEKFESPFVLFVNQKEYVFQFELPFNWFFLYFGAISIALASLVYIVFCPSIVKSFENFGEYWKTGKSESYLSKYIIKYKNQIKIEEPTAYELPYIEREEIEENINRTTTIKHNDGTETKQHPKTKVLKEYTQNLKYYEERKELFNKVYEHAIVYNPILISISLSLYFIGFGLISVILVQNLIYIINYICNNMVV